MCKAETQCNWVSKSRKHVLPQFHGTKSFCVSKVITEFFYLFTKLFLSTSYIISTFFTFVFFCICRFVKSILDFDLDQLPSSSELTFLGQIQLLFSIMYLTNVIVYLNFKIIIFLEFSIFF